MIALLCFYACVGLALTVVVVAPAVHELQRERAEYRAFISGAAREEELGEELRHVRSRISMVRSELVGNGSQVLDDRVIHATLRDAIAKAGMEMKVFESRNAEGQYSLTIKGAFANAVMFASGDLMKFEWLRVESFSARGLETPAHWIELHFWLKTTSYAHSPSERCFKN
jgi:hypothetical protein